MARLVLVPVAAALSFAAAALCAKADPLPPSTFAYDTSAPLNVRVVKSSTSGPVRRTEVTFASAAGGRIHGELIAPAKSSGAHPALMFVHWLGDAATTNLTEFEPDATALARDGMTSLLIDAMWSQPHWYNKLRSTDTDYANSVDQVKNLRRSLDMLLAQPHVDKSRIAYVGHDFGAMYGALLSGIDTRPAFYVLMAGNPSFSMWYLYGKKPANVDAFVAQMAPLEPLQYLSEGTGRGYYFQFSKKDDYIKPQDETAFFEAAPFPRTMSVYDADHGLKSAVVRADRLTWLREKLGGG